MKRFLTVFLSAFLLAAAHYSYAETYSIEAVHYPGSLDTHVYDINDRGQVIGTYIGEEGWSTVRHNFIYDGKNYKTLDALDKMPLAGINNSGSLIGSNENGGFIYDGNSFTSLNFPGSARSSPIDINNSGQVLGWYTFDQPEANGYNIAAVDRKYYLYERGEFKDLALQVPGAINISLSGLNDAGQIAGSYSMPSSDPDFMFFGSNGFIYDNGEYTIVSSPLPDFPATRLFDINNYGQAIGEFGQLSWDYVPVEFLYRNGAIDYLPVLSDMQYLYSINNHGQIAGYFYAPFGDLPDIDHGFIFTPRRSASVPEAPMPVLASMALAGFLLCRRVERIAGRI